MKKILFIAALLFSFQSGFSQAVGIKVITNGNVGIGVADPIEKLHVDGAIKIDNTSNVCNSTNAGIIRWNGTCFEGCDGTAWVGLSNDPNCGGSSGGGPTCTDGIMNGQETGVDCGGPVCPPCGGGGGCQSGCECFPDINAVRPLANAGWNNEFDVGGAGFSGDGELCFQLGSFAGSPNQMIGLDPDPSASANFTSIDYAIQLYVWNGLYLVRAYESGARKSSQSITESAFSNGTYCIRRSGTTIEYLLDGNVFYTSGASSSGDLYYDNSFNQGQAPDEFNVVDIKICPNGTYTRPYEDVEDEAVSIETHQHEHQQQIDDLNEEVSLLKQQINALLGNKDLSLDHKGYDYQLDVDLKGNELFLNQNKPNPFAETTEIEVMLPESFSTAKIDVLNSYGMVINSISLNDQRGYGKIRINAEDLPSGVYSYILSVDGKHIDSKKMVLTK